MSHRLVIAMRTAFTLLLVWGSGRAWAQQPSTPPPGNPVKPENRVVITVDNYSMKGADVEKFIDSLPPQYRAYYRGPGRSLLPQYLVQLKVLAEEAQKENLQDLPEVKEAISIATTSIMADAARKHFEEKIPVSDQELEDLYQKKKPELEEARIRRIVIRTDTKSIDLTAPSSRPPLPEAEARRKLEDLRKQVQAGADFAVLAKANSDDMSTANAGGDMGYMNRQNLLPPLAKAAFSLNPGQVSDIIPTPYGLELIKVEDRRIKPFSEVRQDLQAEIRRSKAGEAFKKEISQHKVEVDNDFFTTKPQSNPVVSPASR